jgi:hypothetical protein
VPPQTPPQPSPSANAAAAAAAAYQHQMKLLGFDMASFLAAVAAATAKPAHQPNAAQSSLLSMVNLIQQQQQQQANVSSAFKYNHNHLAHQYFDTHQFNTAATDTNNYAAAIALNLGRLAVLF